MLSQQERHIPNLRACAAVPKLRAACARAAGGVGGSRAYELPPSAFKMGALVRVWWCLALFSPACESVLLSDLPDSLWDPEAPGVGSLTKRPGSFASGSCLLHTGTAVPLNFQSPSV